MNSIRLKLALAVALAGALISMPAVTTAADPFDIDVILPITGGGTFVGKDQVQSFAALEAAVNKTGGIQGRPVHFVISDDQTNPALSVQLANVVIAKKAAVILGPTFAASCNAVAPLLKGGPVDYCFSPGAHPEPGSYQFSTSYSTNDLIAVAVRYFRERGLKRIATISSTDASGQDGDRAVDLAFADPANKDVTLVDREHFAPADLSVSAQLTRIKATNPQALIAWTSGTPFGTVLRNAGETGLGIPIVTTDANITYAQMKQYAAILPSEMLFTGVPFLAPEQVTDKATKAAIKLFYDSLAATEGVKPGFSNANCWDPTWIVIAAFRKYGTGMSASQLHEYIATLRSYTGIHGPHDFVAYPQRGLGGGSVVIVRWDPSKGTWVGVSKPGGAPIASR